MIRIANITTVHDYSDDRIFYKECKSLKKEGYDVFFIVKSKENKSIEGINIIGLKNYNSRLQRVIFGSIEVFRKALKTKSDLYHFHDPELIFIGILLKLAGKKVIYDVHEDLPKQVLYKDWIKYKFVRKILSAIINVFEHFCCLFYDGIIAATEDIAKKFSKRKTIVLKNFPLKGMIEKAHPPSIKKEKKIIIYVGGLSKIRGIKEIIQAMEHVNINCELWLIGKFENEEYYEECKNLPFWKRVKYMGFKKLDEVYGYIKLADIGLAILYPIKNYLTSLPVKAFEYMAFGKPIIMSDFKYWKEIFSECAIFVDPYNTKQISEKINYLIENKAICEKLGEKGKELIKNKYSWEKEEIQLFEFYGSILNA